MMLSSAHQTDQTQHYCGMIAIGQFDMGGTVLSRDQVVKQRERQGLCVNCGQTRTHRHTFLVGKTAITKQGESLFGWCLKCHTTVSVLSKPGLRIKAEQKKIQWALVHHHHHHQATPSTSIGNNSSTDSSWTEESSSRVFDIVLDFSTSIRSAAVQERGFNELAKAALQDSTITQRGIECCSGSYCFGDENTLARDGGTKIWLQCDTSDYYCQQRGCLHKISCSGRRLCCSFCNEESFAHAIDTTGRYFDTSPYPSSNY